MMPSLIALLASSFVFSIVGCQPDELKSDNGLTVEEFVRETEAEKTKLGQLPDEGRNIVVTLQLNKRGELSGSLLGLAAKDELRVSTENAQREKEILEFFIGELSNEVAPESIILKVGDGVKYQDTTVILSLAKKAMNQTQKEVKFFVQVDETND